MLENRALSVSSTTELRRNRKAFGIAGRIDGRRLGSDSQMGMQAQTGHLNTAALQQWTAKRQRQADRVAIDIVAQRQERRAIEGEVQQTVRTLLEDVSALP